MEVMNKGKVILQKFCEEFKKENYDVLFIEAGTEDELDVLQVFVNLDDEWQQQRVEIRAIPQIPFSKGQDPESHPLYIRIEFLLHFNIDIQNESVPQIESSVCIFNTLVDLPGFEYNAIDDVIQFRTVQFMREDAIDPKFALGLIGAIVLYHRLYGPSFEKIAKGELTLDEILQNSISLLTET